MSHILHCVQTEISDALPNQLDYILKLFLKGDAGHDNRTVVLCGHYTKSTSCFQTITIYK